MRRIPDLINPSAALFRAMTCKIRRYGLKGGLAAIAAISLLPAGCATVPPQPGFHSLANTVSRRTGRRIIWDDNAKADRQIRVAIAGLLSHNLSPDAAVQIALLKNPALQADYERLGISEANLVQAGLLRNPVFSFDLRFPARPYHGWDASIDQTFLDLLFLNVRKGIARAKFAARKAEVAANVLNLAASVKTAFYKVQSDEQLLHLDKKIRMAAHDGLRFARHLRQAGNIAQLPYDEQLALYQQSRLTYANAEAQMLEDREVLTALMGLWGAHAAWRIQPHLPPVPGTDPRLTGLESLAIRQSLAIRAARSRLLAAVRTLKMAGAAGVLSGATVGLNYVRDPDVASTLGPAISIPLPLFNQGQPAIARARAEFLADCRNIDAIAVNLRAAVRRRWVSLIAARHAAVFYRRILLPLRKRIFKETQLAYNGMYAGPYPLLLARQREIRAMRKAVQTAGDYWIARAALENTIGGMLPAGQAGHIAIPSRKPAGKTNHK